MAKTTLTDVSAGYVLTTTYNANNDLIEAAIDNTLSRDGTSPNTMSAVIDMNSNKITNLANGSSAQDAATYGQLTNATLGVSLVTAGIMDAESSTDGQVLTSDGAGGVAWESPAAGALDNVVEDTTPQLGGNLDVNSNSLVSVSNGDINLAPNGTGAVTIDSDLKVKTGNSLIVLDDGDDDFLDITVTTGDAVFSVQGTGVPGEIYMDENVVFGGQGNARWIRIADGDESDYLQIASDGTDINFTVTGGGSLDFADNILRELVLEDVAFQSASEVVSANAVTLTYSEGPGFEIDLEDATGTVTVTISGGPPSGEYGAISVKVKQDSTADRTITWAGGTFTWAGGSAHTQNTGSDAISIYTFETWDGGTNWYATGADYE